MNIGYEKFTLSMSSGSSGFWRSRQGEGAHWPVSDISDMERYGISQHGPHRNDGLPSTATL